MVLSCNMFCQGFSVVVEKLQYKSANIFIMKKLAHIKCGVIVESMNAIFNMKILDLDES